jgi:hypothetical protein
VIGLAVTYPSATVLTLLVAGWALKWLGLMGFAAVVTWKFRRY